MGRKLLCVVVAVVVGVLCGCERSGGDAVGGRIADLEKEVAMLKKASQEFGVVRAQSFILVDEDGKTRATLAADEHGSALCLFDENEKVRAGLSVNKDGPGLGLSDENGKTIFRAP